MFSSDPALDSPRPAGLFLWLWLAYFRLSHSLRNKGSRCLSLGRHSVLLIQPCLKHQHVPQSRRPISPLRKVLLPLLSYSSGFKKSFLTQASLAQQVFRPLAQRASQPFSNGSRKTFLGTVHQSGRDILIQDLSQKPFTLISPLFERTGKAESEINDSMIQKRNTRFQADRHGSPINFHKDVV